MEIKSKEITLVDIGEIIPNPNNRNKHSKEQIERLCKIIEYQGFRSPLIISKRSGLLVSGHGRLEAAIKLDLKQVPVIYQEFESDEQEYAAMVSENSIASWAELDFAAINMDIGDLGPDFDIDLLGIRDFVLEPFDREGSDLTKQQALEELKTIDVSKIQSPIYEPTGEKPKINELYDSRKAQALIEEIQKSSISKEDKEFLKCAANRHIAFDYQTIANYYAHSERDVQELMEKSALVIIDFKQAIENNFVIMSKKLATAFDEDISE